MIRIIVRIDDINTAAHFGGDVHTEYKSFDVSCPEAEEYLAGRDNDYQSRHIVGCEVIATRDRETV